MHALLSQVNGSRAFRCTSTDQRLSAPHSTGELARHGGGVALHGTSLTFLAERSAWCMQAEEEGGGVPAGNPWTAQRTAARGES